MTAPSYFMLTEESYQDETVLARYNCADETPESCNDSALSGVFVDRGGDWHVMPCDSHGMHDGKCSVSMVDGVLELTDTGIKWVVVVRGGEIEVPDGAKCGSDLAAQLGDKLPCFPLEQYEARRL